MIAVLAFSPVTSQVLSYCIVSWVMWSESGVDGTWWVATSAKTPYYLMCPLASQHNYMVWKGLLIAKWFLFLVLYMGMVVWNQGWNDCLDDIYFKASTVRVTTGDGNSLFREFSLRWFYVRFVEFLKGPHERQLILMYLILCKSQHHGNTSELQNSFFKEWFMRRFEVVDW